MRQIISLFTMLLCLIGTTVAQAQSIPLTITAIDSTRFPLVEVEFVLNTAVDNPTAPETYLLSEADVPVDIQSITTVETQPAPPVLIVIDQGLYSVNQYRHNYDASALKQLLYSLGDHFFQASGEISVMTGRNDGGTNGLLHITTDLPFTTDPLIYTQAIDTLDLDLTQSNLDLDTVRPVETPDLIETAIDKMADYPQGIIIYLSALIHAPREVGDNRAMAAARRLSAQALAENVQIVVLQVAASTLTEEIQRPMQMLAYDESFYLQLRHDRDNARPALALYQSVWSPEMRYRAAYRSSSSSSEARTLVLALTADPGQTAEHAFTVNPKPVALTVIAITPLDNNRYQLSAGLDWDEQAPRALTEAQIDNQSVLDFSYSETELSMTFAADSNEPVTLQVSDELNIDSALTVPLPTNRAETAVPTQTPPANEEPPENTTAPAFITPLLRWLPWAGLLTAVAYIIVFQRQQLPHVGQQVRHSVRRLSTIIAGSGQQPTLAYLHIIAARSELIDESIPLINHITTLGRNPQLSDLQLYSEEERSSISGQHCTIQFDYDRFHIIDNGSANGTAVNGTPLLADDPHPLEDGDTIQLGHKAQRGATLRFTISEAIKNRQRNTVADAAFPGSPSQGTPTQVDLEADTPQASSARLPTVGDDSGWLKNLE